MLSTDQQSTDPSGVCPMMVVSSSNATFDYYCAFRVSHSSKHSQNLQEHLVTIAAMTHFQGNFFDFLRTRPCPIITKAPCPISKIPPPIRSTSIFKSARATRRTTVGKSIPEKKTCHGVPRLYHWFLSVMRVSDLSPHQASSLLHNIPLALCKLVIQCHRRAELRVQPVPCRNTDTELPYAIS